jgi:hypothetical protein
MLMGSFDATYEGKAVGLGFPWFLYYLVEYFFARKYRESWKFLPCTAWGKPRALAASAVAAVAAAEGKPI